MIGKPSPGRRSPDRDRLGNTKRRKPWIGDGRRREPVKGQYFIFYIFYMFCYVLYYFIIVIIFDVSSWVLSINHVFTNNPGGV
jgi:hypothetical protein